MENIEETEIRTGNILISRYLFGDPTMSNYYQIGYIGDDLKPLYRRYDELTRKGYSNFHNDWRYLMQAVARIAKDDVEQFSKEDIYIDELKNVMFNFADDPLLSWFIVLKYIKLKTHGTRT